MPVLLPIGWPFTFPCPNLPAAIPLGIQLVIRNLCEQYWGLTSGLGIIFVPFWRTVPSSYLRYQIRKNTYFSIKNRVIFSDKFSPKNSSAYGNLTYFRCLPVRLFCHFDRHLTFAFPCANIEFERIKINQRYWVQPLLLGIDVLPLSCFSIFISP